MHNNHRFTGNLYDVMVSVQNSRIHGDYGFHTKWYPNGYCEVPFVLSVDQRDSENEYAITADYQTAVFSLTKQKFLQYWRGSSVSFLRSSPLLQRMTCPFRDRHSPGEREGLVLKRFNNTYADYPADKSVHELFAEQVQENAGQVALTF